MLNADTAIAGNIAVVEERIQKACVSSGRKREEIMLMGVTKFIPAEAVETAYHAGIKCFGESRVQEAAEKFALLKHLGDSQLHMIGSLQRNKAKQAARLFDCVQSVDREELITELGKHALLKEKPLEVMLELHTGEESKNGFYGFDALYKAAELILSKENIKLTGLMTMAPFTEDTALVRASFRQLANAKKEIVKRFPFTENSLSLSMGMSNDFETAIEEGSNLLRIGSAIFKDK